MVCARSCSCLAFGTRVEVSANRYQAIEVISVGDTVLAAGKDLKWHPANVTFSYGATGASNAVVVSCADTALAVTVDHLFLLSEGKLKAANRLSPHDSLVAPDGSAVKIDSIQIVYYIAGFHHIATKKGPLDANLSDHLLNTNGVVSCDSLQLFYMANELTPFLVQGHEQLPIIGSREYATRY